MLWTALGISVSLPFGCGPIEYIANTPLEAAGAVAEAKHMKADKFAPYEMTAAQEYLHKSRELAGYARFHDSVGFAQKATKNARDARTITTEKVALPTETTVAPGDVSTGAQPAPGTSVPAVESQSK